MAPGIQRTQGWRDRREAVDGVWERSMLRQLSIHLPLPVTSHGLPCPHTISSTIQSFPYTEVLFSLRFFFFFKKEVAFQKLNIELPCDPKILLVGRCPSAWKIYVCTKSAHIEAWLLGAEITNCTDCIQDPLCEGKQANA